MVLPANAPIPTDPPAEQTFGLTHDGQDAIDVVVNEGDEWDLRYVARLASGTGKLDGPKPKGYPITVKMALDADGILHVTAHDGLSGALLTRSTCSARAHDQETAHRGHGRARRHDGDLRCRPRPRLTGGTRPSLLTGPTPGDLLEFFGIPPSPPEELNANIRDKRKYWKKKEQKARTEEGLKLAGACCRPSPTPRTRSPAERPRPAAGERRFRPGATDRCPFPSTTCCGTGTAPVSAAGIATRWTGCSVTRRSGVVPAFVDVRSLVILEAAQNAPGIALDPRMVQSAIGGAYQVLHELPPTEAGYLTLIELLEVAGRTAEIPDVFAEAGRGCRISRRRSVYANSR